jgi:hypothetical protein
LGLGTWPLDNGATVLLSRSEGLFQLEWGLMEVLRYAPAAAESWDEFVARTPAATLLHTRRYLSYHGERFRDLSLLLLDEKERLVGVFPAAVDPRDDKRVVSHPGVTYGGVMHDGRLRGERMIEALKALRDHYAQQGFVTLGYKAVPYIYHREPSSDDLYALFRLGAQRYRCDLSSAIDLAARPEPSDRRRRGLKKALKSGVEIKQGAEFIAPLWRVLEDNLARKHDTKPVHSAQEIAQLHALFPAEIEFIVALLDGQVEAGVVLFATPLVLHAQYIASSNTGHEVCALDALFTHSIAMAQARRTRYFDFGNSNEDEGRYLNAGLFQFKTEFGAGGVAYEFYELSI